MSSCKYPFCFRPFLNRAPFPIDRNEYYTCCVTRYVALAFLWRFSGIQKRVFDSNRIPKLSQERKRKKSIKFHWNLLRLWVVGWILLRYVETLVHYFDLKTSYQREMNSRHKDLFEYILSDLIWNRYIVVIEKANKLFEYSFVSYTNRCLTIILNEIEQMKNHRYESIRTASKRQRWNRWESCGPSFLDITCNPIERLEDEFGQH